MESLAWMETLAALITQCQSGLSLPQGFYLDPQIFARDLDLLRAHWVCAGHISEIPRSGDYLVSELGAESAIIVRGADGVVRALANVCRHRGSRLCAAGSGHAARLVCPYHGWSYDLDGRLRVAREMADGFDAATHGLGPLPLTIAGALIFISFDDAPADITRAAAAIAAMSARAGWQTARVALRRRYSVAANWKLALENYHECYHCGPAHPEFSQLHALARPGGRRLGPADIEHWGTNADGVETVRVMGSALAAGVSSGTRDGALAAPKMTAQLDGACIFAELGLASAFLAYADYGVIYRFIPRGVALTEMEVTWLVRADAQAGHDYDEARLAWLWDVTSAADKQIIERNQAGVASRAYRPGPYSKMETATRQFVDRYVAEWTRAVAQSRGRDIPGPGQSYL